MNKKIILLILFIIALIAVRYSPIGNVLTFENLKRNRQHLLALVQNHYLPSLLVFIAGYAMVTALSIPGAVILTLAGGFLFGTLFATLYVNIGATTGAVLAFLVARYLLGNRMQEKYQKQLSTFNEEMEKNGSRYLLTLRLIPVFPFFLINFLSGLTKVPLKTFAWTTALGIIPGTVVYAYAGQQLGSINALSEILSARVITAFAILALFALFPAVHDRIKAIKNQS
jgi:uncharacterized membrane protein YdjX (TVP38/TMEM64 family)